LSDNKWCTIIIQIKQFSQELHTLHPVAIIKHMNDIINK